MGLALVAALVLPATTSSAAPPPTTPDATSQQSDMREISPNAKYSTKKLGALQRPGAGARAAAGVTPPVGTVRTLIGLDDTQGVYRKPYTLRAVGDKIEVWVANDTAFPQGDCRNQVPNTTTVTDAQAQELADQFDDNMFPKESAAFSVAPDRDGSKATATGVDSTGSGDKIMTLVDNVRDDNFYNFPAAPTYTAGFFSTQFNRLLDRNVMTIDAFDWEHRTTADPPDEPTADLCTSRSARPYAYEGVFAHEYQHLLQSYTDSVEVNWVNEGLSDFAIGLVGYANTRLDVNQPGAQNHIVCWQGYGPVRTRANPNPTDCGGPENSLTLWGDQSGTVGPSAILADYGESWSFMLFLRDRYGLDFMSTLHRDGAHQGLDGVQAALDRYAPGTDQYDVVHDFQVMSLVDRKVGVPDGVVTGIDKARVTTPSLRSAVRYGNPRAYAAPGAPANGADFLVLRNRQGRELRGSSLTSLSFQGADSLVPIPLQWSVVADPPDRPGDPALWSGNASNLDATAVTQVTVPSENPTLTFEEKHLAEPTYDYAYTVVSTDGGKTYTALANATTVTGPFGPALNGDSDWGTQTFDLSAYAGQQVILGFRYVSDGATNDGGWYVDDVALGGQALNDGTTTTPFQSSTEIRPVDVYAWNTRLVGYDAAGHRALVIQIPGGSFTLSADQIAQLSAYPRVVAIVGYDEPTEQYQAQALYRMTVNGVVQPGGGLTSGTAEQP